MSSLAHGIISAGGIAIGAGSITAIGRTGLICVLFTTTGAAAIADGNPVFTFVRGVAACVTADSANTVAGQTVRTLETMGAGSCFAGPAPVTELVFPITVIVSLIDRDIPTATFMSVNIT